GKRAALRARDRRPQGGRRGAGQEAVRARGSGFPARGERFLQPIEPGASARHVRGVPMRSRLALAVALTATASLALAQAGCSSRTSGLPNAPIFNTGASATIIPPGAPAPRSEEHTSELQSREKLVCRLLLEKKKSKKLHM